MGRDMAPALPLRHPAPHWIQRDMKKQPPGKGLKALPRRWGALIARHLASRQSRLWANHGAAALRRHEGTVREQP